MAGVTATTSDGACRVCLSKPTRVNNVTASLALYVIPHPRPDDKKYLVKLLDTYGPLDEGPGTELKKLLSWFWAPDKKKCKCATRVQKMNEWGPDQCEKRIETIMRWLKHSARIAKVPYFAPAVRFAIKTAISRSRSRSTESPEPKIVSIIRPHDKRWAVAVTTAPRRDCTLLGCIESIRKCGWEPVVFAEPGSTKTDCVTFWNETRKGVWHNWRAASEWCLAQETEFVMTVQDDALFHPDTRTFANEILWPICGSVGYVSFYTPKHYQEWADGRQRPFGIYPVNTNSVWGAMALVFPPKVLRQLLDHPRALSWLGAKPSLKKGESKEEFRIRCEAHKEKRRQEPWLIQNSDTAIGIILRKFLKKKLVYVSPSPVDHCSKYSSIGHGGNAGKRNAHYIADPTKPLRPQVLEVTLGQACR